MVFHDNVGFAMACLLVLAVAIACLSRGNAWGFAAIAVCSAVGIPAYYLVQGTKSRRAWYWEPVRVSLATKDVAQMWAQSERGDWMLWFAAHMIGKQGWPTHRQVVYAACQSARTALMHIPHEETRPAMAICVIEGWCEGKSTVGQVKAAVGELHRLTQDDVVYSAAQAVYSAACAVFARENGRGYMLAQAAGGSASRAADADYYAYMRDHAGSLAHVQRELLARSAQERSLRRSADIVRTTLCVPNRLLDDASPYKLVRQWHTNSDGELTGRLNRIPILISEKTPGSAPINGALTFFETHGILRGITLASVVFAAVLLIQALDGGSAESTSRLRAVVSFASILLVVRGYMQGTLAPAYPLVPVAVLFNQVVPIHIQADSATVAHTWNAINISTAIVLIVVAVYLEVDIFLSRRVKLHWK
jgi:hypothetical protein